MKKTYEEINEKIKRREVVVVTAEEMKKIVEEKGRKIAAKEVDVVTTGTFGPMCSSGAFLNLKQTKPRIKIGGGKIFLNGIPAYAGLAAADIYIGATSISPNDPANSNHPGEFNYGGGYVIEDLVAGKEIKLKVFAYGTDCYPGKEVEMTINIKGLNDAILCNPRNAYQNYNCAVNLSDNTMYTYMGVLKPKFGNANYCSAGQLSPLINDPYYKTTGIGTRIFLGGGVGYVYWHGTQHNPQVERGENGVPIEPAGTLATVGDLKQMSQKWIRGISMLGYGASLAVGIGIPIPILNEEIAQYTAIRDEDIYAPIVDYGKASQGISSNLGKVNYKQLKSGKIIIQGKEVSTASLSSYPRAKQITEILKEWIQDGEFLISKPVQLLPSVNSGKTRMKK